MRALLFSIFVVACGGAVQEAATNDLVVAPVAAAASGPSIANPAASAAAFGPGPATPPDARSLSLRMRDQLAQSAASQTGGPDLALYEEALDHERTADLTGARKSYYQLITQYPTSPLLPYAYLAFGDLFFADAENGSPDRFPLAKQAYEKVLSYPPPTNLAFAYAQYRIAACDTQSGDAPHAMASAKRAIEVARANPSSPFASEIAELARGTLVDAFALAGQPDRALAFFRAVDAQATTAMIVELGDRYARRGAARDLTALYASAFAGGRDEVLCRGARAAVQTLARSPTPADPHDVATFEAKRSGTCGP